MAFGDFTVTRASTKNVLGSNGLYQSVANNVPAFEFNTDGSYRGLLVEPGATNLALHSQAFDDAYWVKTEVTVSANAGVAPDGATTSDKLIPSVNSATHFLGSGLFSATSGTAYTFSVFAKADGYDHLRLAFGPTAFPSTGRSASFNLSTGAVGQTQSGVTARIQALPNNYYRCSITVTATSTSTDAVFINSQNADSATSVTFTGDGTSGALLWQAQVETGSVATSPIVTTGSTASRVADVVSLTGASSLIGQTEGTLYVEAESSNISTASFARFLEVGTGSNNRISIMGNSGTVRGFIAVSGTDVQGGTMNEPGANNQVLKIALAYKVGSNEGALYVNGNGDITSPTSLPSPTIINIGSTLGGTVGMVLSVRSVALFPTRLDNTTLANLTTL